MSNDDAVLAANKAFYAAFLDFDKMNVLWAYVYQEVFCLHPGQEPIFGREAIIESWKEVCSEKLNISPANERVLWFGDGLAVVICEEIIAEQPTSEVMIGSNVFVPMYSPGGWGIAGHHAGRKA